jgi:hypothetical protein
MVEHSTTLAILVELANLTVRPDAVLRFLDKHPNFVSEGMDSPATINLPKAEAYGTRFVDAQRVLVVRHYVRELWGNSGDRANDAAAKLLFANHLKRGKDVSEDSTLSPYSIDWHHGKLVYKPLDEFQSALYAMMPRSHLAKVCARPGCAAPYFIARRVTQQYCSSDCADAMQDQWRRNWWKAHGNEWRRKRRQHSRRKRGK